MRIALLPGSYDPMTNGHLEIISRASKMFDKVIVLSAINEEKSYMLCDEARLTLIKDAIKDIPNAAADSYSGFIVDYCAKNKIDIIVKGVRNEKDFVYEKEMALINKDLGKSRHNMNIETMFLCADENCDDISSSLVREYIKNGKDVAELVPNQSLLKSFLGK